MGKVLDVGKKGFHFQDLVRKVYRYYRKKGMSKKKAMELAKKTAGKVFWQKFGKKQGAKIVAKARKLASKKKGGKKRRRKR